MTGENFGLDEGILIHDAQCHLFLEPKRTNKKRRWGETQPQHWAGDVRECQGLDSAGTVHPRAKPECESGRKGGA